MSKAIIIDGAAHLKEFKQIIKNQIRGMRKNPGLAIVMVGDDPASRIYVNAKKKDCKECGINVFEYALSGDVSEEQLIALIEVLNKDDEIDGIIVQLPLPKNIPDVDSILNAIDYDKDVDELTLSRSNTPCTPLGILTLLNIHQIDLEGKKVVILNRSNLIGLPLARMLMDEDATVTICHSKTKNLINECRAADIIITATGGGVKLTADWIKDGAVVIDASTNRDENGKLCGDVEWGEELLEKVSYITPVPGGVGPMTRAMLLIAVKNAAERHGKS